MSFFLKLFDALGKAFGGGPLGYFLALALIVVGKLYRDARKRERELTDELVKQERAFRGEVDQVRHEHMQQMTILITTTHGVLELKAELERKAEKKGGRDVKPGRAAEPDVRATDSGVGGGAARGP
jgi:hypothetical protein